MTITDIDIPRGRRETRHASAALAVLAALDLGPRSSNTICGTGLRTVAFSRLPLRAQVGS